MIYSHTDRIGFIHIPKTGGISISSVLEKTLTNPVQFNDFYKIHATAYWAREWLLGKEAFDKINWFAVIRHPFDILTSYYAFTKCQLPFDQYLKRWWFDHPHMLSHGGFIKTFLCDPATKEVYPNITILRFDELQTKAPWQLPHLNKTEAPKPQLNKRQKDTISEWCWYDIDYLHFISSGSSINFKAPSVDS